MTVYGTDRTRPEDVPKLLAGRRIVHPVLLDPTEAYKQALGLAVWPTAHLLDREGRVVWQGNTALHAFAKGCEKQLEALLGRESADEAGKAPSDR